MKMILLFGASVLLAGPSLLRAQDSSGLTTSGLGPAMPSRTPPPPITDPRNPFYRPPRGVAATPAAAPAPTGLEYPWTLNLPTNKEHAFLSFEASYKAAGATKTYEWQTDYGSSISNLETASSVEIKLANSGQGGGAVRVRWFFYSDSSGKHLIDKGERDVVLWKNQQESWLVSATQTKHDEHYVALGQSYTSGTKVSAWLVQFMTAPNKVAKQIASSSTLETKSP